MSPTAGLGHGHAAAVSPTLAEHEQRWADDLLNGLRDQPAPWRILDVASGDGTLLAQLESMAGVNQLDTRAFERDPALAAAARQRGIAINPDPFDAAAAQTLDTQGWRADLVVVTQALAHVDAPTELVDAIATVLAPAGRVAIEAHDLMGIVRDGQFDAVNHAHSIYPSLASIETMLRRSGLEAIDARRVDVYGGSVQLVARRASSGAQHLGVVVDMASGVAELLAAERAAGLDEPANLVDVGRRAKRVAAELRAFLVNRRSAGARVFGYGAPARGGILLNLASIDSELLPFTVDRNPAKQGLALAGSRIPVRLPEELAIARPDYVLILPWTLVQEISTQLASIRRAGARLVVAMPALEVVA